MQTFAALGCVYKYRVQRYYNSAVQHERISITRRVLYALRNI